MIQLAHKRDCCGCHACVQVCPKGCITMREDNEGFLYPVVDVDSCVDCALCETVCPIINQGEKHEPLAVYAAKNPDDEVRMKSSSGGVFTMLAERTIDEGGVVFGARFSEGFDAVLHCAAEDIEGVATFRGSKYVQSKVGNTYKEAETFLKQDRKVLFSGTPCQIAGLKRYLRREYDNLLTVDVVCHGVPSPLVWREYLKWVVPQGEGVQYVNMRDKRNGWSSYCVDIRTERGSICVPASKNLYIEGFLRDLYLRPSCYACPAKAGRSGSDITLGDFWGVAQSHPQFTDDKGVGLLLVGSKKGADALKEIGANMEMSTYSSAIGYNPCIERSASEPPQRDIFWDTFAQDGVVAIEKVCRRMRPSLISRCVLKMKMAIWHIIHRG